LNLPFKTSSTTLNSIFDSGKKNIYIITYKKIFPHHKFLGIKNDEKNGKKKRREKNCY